MNVISESALKVRNFNRRNQFDSSDPVDIFVSLGRAVSKGKLRENSATEGAPPVGRGPPLKNQRAERSIGNRSCSQAAVSAAKAAEARDKRVWE